MKKLEKGDYHKRDEGVNKQASGPDKKGISEAGVYVRGGDKQRAKIEHEKTRAEQKYMDKPDLGKSLEKAATGHEKGVHKPIAGGGSSAGNNVEYANEVKKDPSLAYYKSPEGTIDDSYADAKRKHKKVLSEMKAMPKPDLGKSGDLEKSLTTPAHSAHGKLAAMLNKLRGTSLDKSEDDQDPASAHLAEIVQTLDDCLRTCTDEQTQEKISLAKDYLSTLMAHLQYEPEMHSALTDLMHSGPESKGE